MSNTFKYPVETGPLIVGETITILNWGKDERLVIRYQDRKYLERRLTHSYYYPSYGFKVTKLHNPRRKLSSVTNPVSWI